MADPKIATEKQTPELQATERSAAEFHAGDEIGEYQALSTVAVISLFFGLLSPLVLLSSTLIFIPGLAVLFGVFSLIKIRNSSGMLTGRKGAIVGICLAAIFGMSVPAKAITEEQLLYRQAKPLADEFLELLRHREPHKAMQLLKDPEVRRPLDGELWEYYRENAEAKKELEAFVSDPMIHALLAQGTEGTIRYYQPYQTGTRSKGRSQVELQYALSFKDESGKPESIIFSVFVQRTDAKGSPYPTWVILSAKELGRTR